MSAEATFKEAVSNLLDFGIYPSPGAVRKQLGRPFGHNLSGKECTWRDEVWEPWMTFHPDHNITITRRLNQVKAGSPKSVTLDEILQGLREMELDLR